MPPFPPTSQRMFHGGLSAVAVADQFAARFHDRQHKAHIERYSGSALVQLGSKHGTPLTVNLADLEGGVLISMSRDRDWLDRVADASELVERAATNPLSLLALVPDLVGELNQTNLAPQVWEALDDIFAMSRALAGENDAPQNPKVCLHCGTANDPRREECAACGAPLPVDLPRVCPKCGRGHTSDALFCQSCGTRLVNE